MVNICHEKACRTEVPAHELNDLLSLDPNTQWPGKQMDHLSSEKIALRRR